MRTHKILRTQAFRIVAIYLAIFALSAFALVAFVYWNTARVLDRETDATLEAEVTGLVEQYQRLPFSTFTDVIIGRSVRGDQGLYLLANNDHRVIAGNLDSWRQSVHAGARGVPPLPGGRPEIPEPAARPWFRGEQKKETSAGT